MSDAVVQTIRERASQIRAMAELGIDILGQRSKTLVRYLGEPFDEVITVCDAAARAWTCSLLRINSRRIPTSRGKR